MSHCEHLPRYIVAVEVSEALENGLAAAKIGLELLRAKNLALSESLQGIIDDCGPDLPVWRVEDALSLISQSNQP